MVNIALISLYGIENSGIRSISSVLKANGFNPCLIFFKRWMNNDISYPSENEKMILISLLEKLKIEVVGLSFTSPFLKIAIGITKMIKERLSIKVVWGGMHATARPEECLRYCDAVCRGEGEEAMYELIKEYAKGQPLGEGIKNISYKKENEIISGEMRPLIRDLNLLPNQDYGGDGKFFIEEKLFNIDPLINARELRVFASRGCPFSCSYCYNSILKNLYRNEKYHRIKSVENVISEIEYALSKFKRIRKIKFDDDTFMFPREWIDEFCAKYNNRIGLPFEILFNAEGMDEKLLINLKNAGLRRIQVGIQTGSQKESELIYNRKLPTNKLREFADMSKSLKLGVVYDIILDNPLSTFEDKKALINFLLTLPRPFDLFVYSLTLFPGTELCETLLKKGIIRPEDVEGEANKSFYQFRLSFSFPRKKEELFVACIVSLISKSFLPKSFIGLLSRSDFLKNHPFVLKKFAQICNLFKLLHILIKMSLRGDMGIWKFKEYGMPKRFLIQ